MDIILNSAYVGAETKIPNPYNAVFHASCLVVRNTFYHSNVPVVIGTNILKVAAGHFEGDSHGDGSNIGKAWPIA